LTVNTVQTAPAITSANNTTFTVGAAGSFTVTTTGAPTPSLTETGTLPSGVTFKDNGNGTGTLSGTPASGTAGTYSLTITASNGVGTPANQSFTLKIHGARGR
jgi:large repetitive protein